MLNWNHFTLQLDTLSTVQLFVNGDAHISSAASISQYSLGLIANSYYPITLCDTSAGGCSFFTLKALKVWGGLQSYTGSELLSKQSLLQNKYFVG